MKRATQADWLRSAENSEAYIAKMGAIPENQLRWSKVHDDVGAWISKFGTTGNLLDVGCRRGELMRSKSFPPTIVYFGIDPLRIDGQNEFNFRCETLETTSFPDAMFDFVIIKDSFDYFLEPRKALAAAFRLLKPGGYFLLTEGGHPSERVPRWKTVLRTAKGYARAVIKRDYRALRRQKAFNAESIYPNGDIPTSDILGYCKEAGFLIVGNDISGGRLFLAAIRPVSKAGTQKAPR